MADDEGDRGTASHLSSEPAAEDSVVGFDLLAAPGHLLRRAHQRSYELFTRRVGTAATRQQFALLLVLAQRPGASQRELVDASGMDKSTLKEMLERLVARGWVQRERDPADSRAWTMRVTEAGRALIEGLLPQVAAAQREILAPLPEQDRPVFMRMLRTLLGFEEPPVH